MGGARAFGPPRLQVAMRGAAVRAILFAAVAFTSCRHTDVVGSLTCTTSKDCLPPSTICSADGRCVTGCKGNPNLCIGGATCDGASGECTGGTTATSCGSDADCDPPDLVCSPAALCAPGCTITLDCDGGDVCNPTTGHCCTPGDRGCPTPMTPGSMCNGDAECPGAPANICSAGVCVPGCASGGSCTAPLSCDPSSGHCITPMCARDMDCDPGSYCTQAHNCVVLAFGGAIDCAGGTDVTAACAASTSPSAFVSCAGKGGPVGCPYCIGGSCMHPGLCTDDDDCHGGDHCAGGLCSVVAPQCPSVVDVTDVDKGTYAAGKEVCIRGAVTQVRKGYDGELEVKIGSTPYLYVDIEPMYGLTSPTVGQTITAHGTVRWDSGHQDRELLPVDWFAVE